MARHLQNLGKMRNLPQYPAPFAIDMPLFKPCRGARQVTQDAAKYLLAVDPGPLYDLAGVMWPARRYLNKLSFITGKPGSGKTAAMKKSMQSQANLFSVLDTLRWLTIDPTNTLLPYLFQILPLDVPILRVSPQDADGLAWDIGADITNETLNEALQTGLFPDALFQQSSDKFWYTKGREMSGYVVNVYHDRRSPWEFHDLVIPIRYPQFLKPLFLQSPRTRGQARSEIVGRLGRDIKSTSSSVLNRMATAAALWRNAKRKFSIKEFLESRSVMHFAFTPDLAPSLSGIANAMTYMLILMAIKRNDETNHTILWCDESRYLADISGLDDIAARGRGSGLGLISVAQGLPGLVAKWGEKRASELLDLICTWVTFSAGHETAQMFSRMVGQVEGIQKSYGTSVTTSTSRTEGVSTSSGGTFLNPTNSVSRSESVTHSSSFSYSENFQLVTKDSILPSEITNLPLADPIDDLLQGFAFNPDVGAFRFQTDFIKDLEALPAPPFIEMPMRPDHHQRLEPWTLEDIRRLNLELTPDMIKALHSTWGNAGGPP